MKSLRASWLIEKIMKKGRVIKTPFFSCSYFESKTPFSQFCFIVGTRVSKKATERNRIKRRLKEAFISNISDLKHPVIAVIIGRNNALTCDFKNLKEEVKKCIQRTINS